MQKRSPPLNSPLLPGQHHLTQKLKFDLVHSNCPQTKFIIDSLYKHPVFWLSHCALSCYRWTTPSTVYSDPGLLARVKTLNSIPSYWIAIVVSSPTHAPVIDPTPQHTMSRYVCTLYRVWSIITKYRWQCRMCRGTLGNYLCIQTNDRVNEKKPP